MAVLPDERLARFFASDLDQMAELAREVDANAGVVDDPQLTIERLREMLRELGLRPDDNAGSRELMKMRYGDDWQPD